MSCVIHELRQVKLTSLCIPTPLSPSRGRPCYVEQPCGRLGENPSGKQGQQTDESKGGTNRASNGLLVLRLSEEDGLIGLVAEESLYDQR